MPYLLGIILVQFKVLSSTLRFPLLRLAWGASPSICPHELILLHVLQEPIHPLMALPPNSLYSLDLEEVKAGDASLLNEFKVEEAYDSEGAYVWSLTLSHLTLALTSISCKLVIF